MKTSDVTGYSVIPIDRARLIERMNAAFICVGYELGAKPRPGSLPGTDFKLSDCSGIVRWLLYAASYGKIKMPMGSWGQRKWCQEQGFKPCPYSNCALLDSRLRIAFKDPDDKHGHVWLCINGQTIECYYGHGAGRRPWNTKVLKNNGDFCFVLTDELR